jgi:signal transduction histidine kinase/CheY-like chemotaxis protein
MNERLRMKSIAGGYLTSSCFNVNRDFLVEVYATKDINYDTGGNHWIEPEAIEWDAGVRDQHRQTKAILLSVAKQIPDPTQRRQFIRNCSAAGMQRNYDAGRREIIMEYRRYTDRGLIWVQTRMALLPDPETGDLLAFYYTTDINERKIGQEVLARLTSIGFENASYVDLKTQLIHSLKVRPGAPMPTPDSADYTKTNETYIPLYVYEADQEKCHRLFDLQNILEQLETTLVYDIEFRLKDAYQPIERPYRHVRMSAFYLNREKRYIIFGRSDITRQIEEEANRNAVLQEALVNAEKANEAKTNFLSRMSHDIRTPLNGIIGMTYLALDEEMPASVRSYLKKIDESSHFLLTLVNDILDMSKVESGKMELHPEHYTYPELLQHIEAVIQPLCDAKNITFTIDNPFTDHAILTDKVRLNQILFNLLSNAVKFTPKGGNVRLEFFNHMVHDQRLSMDIRVSDNGIGISSAFQKKLFQPFEQENSGRNDARIGSGLGLAIVKSLVDLMGGTIFVDSTPGQGSTFTIHLDFPIVSDTDSSTANKSDSSIDLTGKRILVVEDNAINGEIVSLLLEKKGAKVLLAINGLEAVTQYANAGEHYFDAILMDVRMPLMDGLEATQEIRALPRPDAKAIPILAMTANAYADDIAECLSAGMNAHIAKPVDPDILFHTLKEYLV